MAVRRESVVLDLDDRLTPGMIRAAAATGLLERELKGLSGQSVGTSRSLSNTEGEVRRLSTATDNGARSIDKYSGGLGLLVDSAIALGPALVPIGAELIPLVTTATADLGFLGAAAGVTVLAFHGLGTALTAFNKAELEPTAANIQAAQLAMDKLPPAAQAFVVELHRLNPELDKLRQSAASGLMPGLTQGLESAVTVGPLAQRTIHGIAVEMGSLADQAGRAVSGPEGRSFLKFFGRETPLALHEIGTAAGFGADGVFHLVKAFTPLTRDVNAGLVQVAKDFDQWATNLNKTKDFQSFLAYIQANGPKVEALLGDIGSLFVDIVKAAAPLGGPTLEALNLIVHALDLIASSQLATPLLALAQIAAVLRLTSRGLGAVGVSSNLNLKTRLTANAKSASTAMFGVVSAQDRAKMSAKDLEEQQAKTRAAFAGSAIAITGIALASSGAADAMGLQNTTMLATTGLMVGGPWGAAIGGGVGLLMDFQAANKQSAAEVDALNSAVSNFAESDNIAGLGKLADQATAATQAVSSLGSYLGDQITSKLQIPINGFATLSNAVSDFNNQLTGQLNPVVGLTNIQQVANRMQPAMAKLGLTFNDLLHMNSSQLQTTIDRLVHITNAADSARGRTVGVAKAFADMSNQALTTDQRIQALSDALDTLLGPGLNLSAATDAWRQGLNDLDKQLSKSTKSLVGQSDAVINNRALIRAQVSSLSAMVKAEAAAGESPQKMTAALRQQRQALIDAGVAAGMSRSQLKTYLDELGLTPKMVKTAIQLAGVPQAIADLQKIKVHIDGLHDKTIVIRTVGVNTIGTGGHNTPDAPHKADGGFISGPGGPRSDAIPAWLSNGEFVVNAAATARHLSLLHSINAQRFAGGGVAGGVASAAGSDFAGQAVAASAGRLQVFQQRLDEATKSLDKEKQTRDALVSRMQQLSQSARDSSRSDLFAPSSGGIWSGSSVTNPLGVLHADTAAARKEIKDIRDLTKSGVHGQALAAIINGGPAAVAMMADESRKQLQQFQHAFQQRQQVTARVGHLAGSSVYSPQLDTANQHLASLRGDVHRLTTEVKHLKAEQAKNAQRTGAAAAQGVNTGVGTAVRRARRR